MDILTYRKQKGISQAAFAALLTNIGTPATQGLVSQWEKGTTAIRAERAVQIELATVGAITRYDLLPAVFGATPSVASQPLAQGAERDSPVRQLVDIRMSKRALRAKVGAQTDRHLAVVLGLPAEEVESWPDEGSVPAVPAVVKLLGLGEEPAKAEENDDPDADRIAPIEVA